jgi:hypothetical protein
MDIFEKSDDEFINEVMDATKRTEKIARLSRFRKLNLWVLLGFTALLLLAMVVAATKPSNGLTVSILVLVVAHRITSFLKYDSDIRLLKLAARLAPPV